MHCLYPSLGYLEVLNMLDTVEKMVVPKTLPIFNNTYVNISHTLQGYHVT